MLIAAAAAAALFSFCAQASEQVVNGGVFIEGIDVSGMTRSEMETAIDEKVWSLSKTQVVCSLGEDTRTVSLAELGLTWTNPEILDDVMLLGSTGNVLQRYKDRKDIEKDRKEYSLTWGFDRDLVNSFAKSCENMNTEPENARIYTTDELLPGVEGGTDGIRVNAEKTAAVVSEAILAWDGSSTITADIAYDTVAPEVPYEELALVCDPLGTATTDYSFSAYERCVNVENGCSKISGTLLYPGDYFSVTDAVTPFTAENGYLQAPSYEENRVVDSYGGGICQVSTTLYNAVLKSELEVVSRSNHTMAVSYVDLSKDAAIAEGVMDFAFVNTKDEPVYIIGYAYGGTISFTIYGHETRPANRSIEFVSVTTSTTEATSAMLYANPEQPVGYINQTQSPHTGYTAELWKNVYVDGNLTDTIQINSSYYNAVGTIYDIGVMSANGALTQAMYTAIASNDLSQVQGVIANGANYGNTTAQSESNAAAQPEAVQPEAEPQQAEPAPEQYVDPSQGELYVEEGNVDVYVDPAASGETWVEEPAGGEDVTIMPDWDEPTY